MADKENRKDPNPSIPGESAPEQIELQKKWFAVGIVPQQNVKDLWDSYNYFVDKLMPSSTAQETPSSLLMKMPCS